MNNLQSPLPVRRGTKGQVGNTSAHPDLYLTVVERRLFNYIKRVHKPAYIAMHDMPMSNNTSHAMKNMHIAKGLASKELIRIQYVPVTYHHTLLEISPLTPFESGDESYIVNIYAELTDKGRAFKWPKSWTH